MHFDDRSARVPVEGATFQQQVLLAELLPELWLTEGQEPETVVPPGPFEADLDLAGLAPQMATYIATLLPEIHRYRHGEPLQAARPMASNEAVPEQGCYAHLGEGVALYYPKLWEQALEKIQAEYRSLFADPLLATTYDQLLVDYTVGMADNPDIHAFGHYFSYWAFSMPSGEDSLVRVPSIQDAMRGMPTGNLYFDAGVQHRQLEFDEDEFIAAFTRVASDPYRAEPTILQFARAETIGEFDTAKSNANSPYPFYFRVLAALHIE